MKEEVRRKSGRNEKERLIWLAKKKKRGEDVGTIIDQKGRRAKKNMLKDQSYITIDRLINKNGVPKD